MDNNNKQNGDYYLYVIALIILAAAVAFIYFKYYKDKIPRKEELGKNEIVTYEEAQIKS